MASLGAIRDGVKTTVEANITSLHVYDTVADVTNLPALVVAPTSADFTVSMGRGTDTYQLNLFVLTSYGEPGLGQDQLDTYVTGAGPDSVRQTIFNNRTLGLAGVDAHIAGMTDYSGRFEQAAIDHIGARLLLIVHTTGTA